MKINFVFEWFRKHSLIRHLVILLIVVMAAWGMGQLAAPALLKAIFL